ncbi:MAG: hypothetical protein V3T84_01525 [Phycisphaerales bacterium]
MLFLLLLGAVINVAVAWGCAFSVYIGRSTTVMWETRLGPQHYWVVTRNNRQGATRIVSGRARSRSLIIELRPDLLVPRWSRLSKPTREFEATGSERRIADARGWPMISMCCVIDFKALYLGTRKNVVEGGVSLEALHRPGSPELLLRALPLRPIWLGFTINTVFYAAVLWLVMFGPFTARRMIRRKRGCCIKCGYDLRGTSGGGGGGVCSECGAQSR